MTSKPYRTNKIGQGVYQISDVMDNRAYMVVGERSAVLVDTCVGYGDVRSVVREITHLPVTVLLTHSHYDHVGGAYFFAEVQISALDDGQWAYERGTGGMVHEGLVKRGTFATEVPFGPRDGAKPAVRHVVEGDVFDLGGLTLEAVALPGHTPGSMGYLVRERRVLLSGDAVTPIMCLFFPRSMGMPAYRETLSKMADLPFDRFYTGHHDTGFRKETLPSFDAAAEWSLTHRGRGIVWRHALLEGFEGLAYLPPCGTRNPDSPDYRALICPMDGA